VYFQKITSQQKRKSRHLSIQQYFCSKPKHKFRTVSQPESANGISSDCKGSFDSIVQEYSIQLLESQKHYQFQLTVSPQHLTITLFTLHCYRIRVGLGIPQIAQARLFQSWIRLKGFDESLQMNSLCMLTEEAQYVAYALKYPAVTTG